MILQLTHLKTTVGHFAWAFLLLRWLCFPWHIPIIRIPNGVGCLWPVTFIAVLLCLAECEPGAWKKQQEQTGAMRCSPGVVTTTSVGTWIDFDLILIMCAVTESEKAADGERKGDGWLFLCWIRGFLSLADKIAGLVTLEDCLDLREVAS